MNIALRHRDLYSQVAAIAGFFHAEDYEGVFAGSQSIQDANSPDDNLDTFPLPRILLMDGEQDTEPAVAGETQRFAGLLAARHIANDVVLAPGHHDWDYVATQVPAVIGYLGDGFAGPPAWVPSGHSPPG
jgi:S-formylglutathione hydrolase FrmB